MLCGRHYTHAWCFFTWNIMSIKIHVYIIDIHVGVYIYIHYIYVYWSLELKLNRRMWRGGRGSLALASEKFDSPFTCTSVSLCFRFDFIWFHFGNFQLYVCDEHICTNCFQNGFIAVPFRCPCMFTLFVHWTYFDFNAISLRWHFEFTSISLSSHLYFTLFHFDKTSVSSLIFRFHVASMSFRTHFYLFHFELPSIALWFNCVPTLLSFWFHFAHFDFSSISQRSYFHLTLIPLRSHFDFTSIWPHDGKGAHILTRGKGKFAKKKRKGQWAVDDFAEIWLGLPAARTHTRTHGMTQNDFPFGLTPQSPIHSSICYSAYLF